MGTGEPMLGMAMLKTAGGQPRLAVGTRFGVHLFACETTGGTSVFKKVGSNALPLASFAGPGGKNRDRVFAIGPDGSVTVLTLR
jgi:hypothetical protein